MKSKSKVWLESKGQQIFGSGKARILRAVQTTGSLNAAAKELNMSYRHVWSAIQAAEERFGKVLLVRTRGGATGGGAVLTRYAEDLLDRFEILDRDVRAFADKRFKEVFKQPK